MAKRKTWQEKLDNGRQPKVERLSKSFAGIPAGAAMLVSTPREVDRMVRKIPAGRFVAPEEIRLKLAALHGADATCPVSTGIFFRIVSEAAWEQIQQGADPAAVTPFWRVIAAGSPTAAKIACGPSFLRKMQKQEGIVLPK